MATYVVATRRAFRGRSPTAKDAVEKVSGIKIKGASNPDIVVIETVPELATKLQETIGEAYLVERELEYDVG